MTFLVRKPAVLYMRKTKVQVNCANVPFVCARSLVSFYIKTFKPLTSFCRWVLLLLSYGFTSHQQLRSTETDLIGNRGDIFSRNAAQMSRTIRSLSYRIHAHIESVLYTIHIKFLFITNAIIIILFVTESYKSAALCFTHILSSTAKATFRLNLINYCRTSRFIRYSA